MTVFDASAADQSFEFTGTNTPPDLLDFASAVTATATTYSWRTTSGHLVTATGSFTYAGADVSGTVTALTINLSEDADTDITITGVANANIDLLLASHQSFWTTLFSGGDTFTGAGGVDSRISGDQTNDGTGIQGADHFTVVYTGGGSDIYGDSFNTTVGPSFTGGDDVFDLSGTMAITSDLYGDTGTVNSGEIIFGGDDEFAINLTSGNLAIYGDGIGVTGGALTGGNDTVIVTGGTVTVHADGSTITSGSIIGGDDVVTGAATVYGDTTRYAAGVLVGGDDVLSVTSFAYGDSGSITSAVVSGGTFTGGDDQLTTYDLSALLYGDIGDITVDVSGTTFVFGNDTFSGGTGNDTIYGDYGTDTLSQMGSAGGNDTVLAGAGADTIYGQGGDDVIDPGEGNDAIVDGGAGSDTISYASLTAAVTVDLNLQGAVQNTVGGGNDTLSNFENTIGGSGNDTLIGDGGDNIIEGGSGADDLTGGANAAGGDTASYAGATAGVTVSLGLQGVAQDTVGAGIDILRSFENLTGSAHGDTLTGNGGDNDLDGGGGGDTLSGGGGADTINGGAGGDDITGGSGADTLNGDAGDDTFHQLNDGAANAIDGGDDTDTLDLSASTTGWTVTASDAAAGLTTLTLLSIENVTGSELADRITGSSAANILNGGGGRDILDGGAGVDQLFGGNGADAIVYDALDDLDNVLGGNGTDTLIVMDQAAPTTFNLFLHEFEFADVVATDTGAEVWATNTWTYDQAWRAIEQTLRFDDLTMLVNGYDLAGLLDWTEDYDATGALTRYTNFDQDGTEGEWTSFYDLYSGGVRTQRFVDYDNGTSQREGFDAAANVLWRQEYDATDTLIRYTEYDVPDSLDWADYYNLYVAGIRTQQYMNFDDGTAIRNGYDAAGNLDWVEEYWDAGVTRSRYVDYDQAGDQTWTYAVTYYDTNGVQTSRYILYDDGSELYL